MERFRHFRLKAFEDERFTLTALELKDCIDFEVRRLYFLTHVKKPTGEHCHRREKELFVMLTGTATAVIDAGSGLREIPLRGGRDALYVANYVWHHFKGFSKDAVLLALSSTNYNPDRSDYIEDYREFRRRLVRLKKFPARKRRESTR